MRVCALVSLFLVVILTLDVIGQCEGWWRGRSRSRSRSSSSRSSKPSKPSSGYSSTNTNRGKTVEVFGKTVHVGKGGIRDRDETGHGTGLGTLLKKMVTEPKKTVKAGIEFGKSYFDMRKANKKGGNLAAHEEANRKATQVSDAETAAAFSAVREQFKRVRVKQNPDGGWHVGDTRTKQETDATMNANKKGRENSG